MPATEDILRRSLPSPEREIIVLVEASLGFLVEQPAKAKEKAAALAALRAISGTERMLLLSSL